jgi:hypothetical protein
MAAAFELEINEGETRRSTKVMEISEEGAAINETHAKAWARPALS